MVHIVPSRRAGPDESSDPAQPLWVQQPTAMRVADERGTIMPILWRAYRHYADQFEGHSLGARPDCLYAETDFVVFAAGKAPEIVKRLCCPELISEEKLRALAGEVTTCITRK